MLLIPWQMIWSKTGQRAIKATRRRNRSEQRTPEGTTGLWSTRVRPILGTFARLQGDDAQGGDAVCKYGGGIPKAWWIQYCMRCIFSFHWYVRHSEEYIRLSIIFSSHWGAYSAFNNMFNTLRCIFSLYQYFRHKSCIDERAPQLKVWPKWWRGREWRAHETGGAGRHHCSVHHNPCKRIQSKRASRAKWIYHLKY
jgi:hypothetical protein